MILLAHTAIEGMPITDKAMRDSAFGRGGFSPHTIVRIRPCHLPRDGFDEGFDWGALADHQRELCETQLHPAQEAHPSWPIIYFGMVPIPLAVHLGTLVGQAARVTPRLHHHDHRNWGWTRNTRSWRFARAPKHIPANPEFQGAAVIRVSTSYEIAASQTDTVAPTPFSYDVRSRCIDPDSIRSLADLESVAGAYKSTLDRIVNSLPNSQMRHLFASVPVGLAFRLGTALNPNLHLPLQTWKHMSRRKPEYRRAILIGQRTERPRVLLLAAAPSDTSDTTAIQEVREIQEILAACGPGIEVIIEEAVTRQMVPELLRSVDPKFVHFAGHGQSGQQEAGLNPTRDLSPPAIVVHGSRDDSRARPVALADFTRWMGEGRTRRTVLLTACHSEALAKAAASRRSICIGFRERLPDNQARAFARGFWKSMRWPGRTVCAAFQDGLAQMDTDAKNLAHIFPPQTDSDIYLIPRGGNHG